MLTFLDGKLDVLFQLFCISYLVAFPVIRWGYPELVGGSVMRWVPLPPLSICGLTVLNLVVSAYLFNGEQFAQYVRHAAGELRETVQALIFALFAFGQAYVSGDSLK